MSPEEILARALSGPVRLTFASPEDANVFRFRLYDARGRWRDRHAKLEGVWSSPWDGLGVYREGPILIVRPRDPISRQPLKIETEASRDPVPDKTGASSRAPD